MTAIKIGMNFVSDNVPAPFKITSPFPVSPDSPLYINQSPAVDSSLLFRPSYRSGSLKVKPTAVSSTSSMHLQGVSLKRQSQPMHVQPKLRGAVLERSGSSSPKRLLAQKSPLQSPKHRDL